MNLPDFIRSDAPTLSLIVRAKLSNELPGTSYDDAWDALESPEDYAPGPEIEAWMRENWHGVIFGAQPQPDAPEIPQKPTVSRALARSWMPKFLEVFEMSGGNASKAAREAKVDHSTPYDARKVDPVFAEAWLWAERRIGDRLRSVMWDRGVEGWDETVFGAVGDYKDGPIGVIRKYDHSFIKQMATARCEELRAVNKEGAAQVNASASASASASSTSVAMSAEEIEKLQARKQRQLEKQAARNERLEMSKVGNN